MASSTVDAIKILSPDLNPEWIEVAGASALFDGGHSPCAQTFGLGMEREVNNDDLHAIESFFLERGATVLHELSPLVDISLLALFSELSRHCWMLGCNSQRSMGARSQP